MRQLLEALTAWPEVDTEDLRRRPEWEQARAWGWVMESGELTGTGLARRGVTPWDGVGVSETPADSRCAQVDCGGFTR